MALVVADRVQETSTTTGTGSYTLAGAVTGYQAFSSVCANGSTVECFIEDVDANGVPTGGWEIGTYTWSTGGTLARTSITASSNANAAVSWAAGTRRIGLSLIATRLATLMTPGSGTDKLFAYLNTAANTTGAGWQKAPMDTISFDTGSIWDSTNKRVIPKKAGYYQVTMRARTGTVGSITAGLGFNGSQVIGLGADGGSSTSLFAAGGTALMYFNGSTDYVEAFIFCTLARAYTTGSFDTYLQVFGPI